MVKCRAESTSATIYPIPQKNFISFIFSDCNLILFSILHFLSGKEKDASHISITHAFLCTYLLYSSNSLRTAYPFRTYLFRQNPIIFFLIIIFMDSIIFIQSIAAAFISDKLHIFCINILHALSCFCNRDAFAASNEKRHFIESNIHIMNSFSRTSSEMLPSGINLMNFISSGR